MVKANSDQNNEVDLSGIPVATISFQNIIENINVGVSYIDSAGVVLYTSPAFCKIYGVDKGMCDNLEVKNFFAPQMQKVLSERIQLLQCKKDIGSKQYPMRRYDGSTVWIQAHSTPLFDEDGKLKGIYTTHTDITEQKNIELELRTLAQKYQNIYESMSDGFFTMDLNGKILECNKCFAEMLGREISEVVETMHAEVTDCKWHDLEESIIIPQIITSGNSVMYEKEYIRKNGKILPVEIRVHLLRDLEGNPQKIWGIVHDITSKKEAEWELHRSNQELAEAHLKLQEIIDEKNKYIVKSEEYNQTLKMSLAEAKENKIDSDRTIFKKISNEIIPLLNKLKKCSDVDKLIVNIIEEKLYGLIDSDKDIPLTEGRMTVSEHKIISMIKSGFILKEIAKELNLSEHTVYNHVGNIRKKLGIRNKKINLKAFLTC
ncbi:MAG: PAS domain S-box protein [Oligoflexia bacterium]|nr:PAS domain S-box protein [Oligoflexia bacterium]